MIDEANRSASARRMRALAHAKRIAVSIEGVTGVDFGVIYKGGNRTNRLGIRFHVAAKLVPKALPAGQLLPRKIMGFACDVIQAKYCPHADTPPNPHSTFDPIRPGISIGNLLRTTTGTLGAIVRDRMNGGAVCVLSNWHVLCASTQCAPGEQISQPGSFDLGSNPPRVVAKLLRWINLAHGCDAAITSIDGGVHAMDQPLGIGIEFAQVAEPQMHMKLAKSGLSSGVTHAIVDGLHGSYQMDYSTYGDAKRFMDGIRLVTDPNYLEPEVSLDGDSGAVWVDSETRSAVALHFAGEDGMGPLADYAVAHPLSRVLQLLDVEL